MSAFPGMGPQLRGLTWQAWPALVGQPTPARFLAHAVRDSCHRGRKEAAVTVQVPQSCAAIGFDQGAFAGAAATHYEQAHLGVVTSAELDAPRLVRRRIRRSG